MSWNFASLQASYGLFFKFMSTHYFKGHEPILDCLYYYLQDQLVHSLRFLIVHEQLENQQIFRYFLTQLNYNYQNIKSTHDGYQALEWLWGPGICNWLLEKNTIVLEDSFRPPAFDVIILGLKLRGGLCCGWISLRLTICGNPWQQLGIVQYKDLI